MKLTITGADTSLLETLDALGDQMRIGFLDSIVELRCDHHAFTAELIIGR